MKIKFKNLVCPLLLSLALLNPLFVAANTNNIKVIVLQDNDNPLMLKVSIEVKNATPEAFFSELKKSSGGKVSFVYSPSDVASIAPITYSAKGVTVEKLLSDLLTPHSGLTYSVEKNIITIKKVTQTKQTGTRKVNLSGSILDEQKKPIPGVTVLVTGTTKGAITDDKGRFAIATEEGQELEISYVGMVDKKYKIKANEENVTIILVKDAMEVEDVIVTGYQSVRRERMTGSSTTVTAKEIEGRGLSSVNEVLNSTISGLNMVASGRPGADAQIQIRGINSINGSSEPMWIVDGMPMQGEIPNIKVGSTDLQSTIFTSGIGNIAPDDIKSITVLKDAAATAVYGARAANGVIVVETKSGLVGKTRYNFSVNFGIVERPVNNIEMMNTQQKIQFERELFQDETAWLFAPSRVMGLLNRAAYGEISSEAAEQEISRLSGINTDWFKEIFRTAVNQQYNFSMSGGTEKTQHYTSFNYTQEDGTQRNNSYSRLGMTSKITHNPTKNLRITGGLAATVKNDKISASEVDPLNYAMYANPYERPYHPDGSYAYDVTYNPELSVAHPGIVWDKFNIIQELENNTKTSRYIDAEIQLKVEWELFKGLMFTSHGIYNVNSNHDRIEEGEGTYTNYVNNWYDHYEWGSELDTKMAKGSLKELTGQSDSYTWKNTLQYNKEIKDRHFINVFVGQEVSQRKSDNFYNYSPIYDKLHNIIGYPDMSGVPSTEINFSKLGNTGRLVNLFSSFFGNASYSYRDRYIITGALRYDGADILGDENQFTPLWNVAGRWNVHKEKFMESFDKINILSFRAGYGFTGSIDRGAFPFLVYSLGQSVIYDGQNVPTSFSYPNPNIKWQTKKDFNVGFDVSLFDYRVELTANYYNNVTRDVLDNKRLAVSSGRKEAKANVANLHNNGYEIDLGINPVRGKNFNWFVKFNVAYNENKVKDTFYKSVDELPTKALQSEAQKFVEGYSAGSWFGYKVYGVNPMTGTMLVKVNNSDATYDMAKEYYDIPGNMMNFLGLKYPPWVGGFSTTITWKQLIFSASFEFKAGHKIKSFNMFKDLDSQNRHVNDLDRWRQPGDITNIPRQTQKQVYKIIIDDLKEALSCSTPARETYNVFYDKRIIHALLAQVYLFKGDSGAGEGSDYTNAITHAREAMSGRNLQGLENYLPAPAVSKQGVDKTYAYSLYIDGRNDQVMQNITGGSYYAIHPTDDLYNLYDDKDIRKTTFFDDTRKIIKYKNMGSYTFYNFFSVAEMHLIVAEGYVRSGNNGEAKKWLDDFQKCRIRDYSGYSGSDLLDEILRERRKEFCYEYDMRWCDLVRTQKGWSRNSHPSDENPISKIEDNDFRFCFPIPVTEELQYNDIEQNPGWSVK